MSQLDDEVRLVQTYFGCSIEGATQWVKANGETVSAGSTEADPEPGSKAQQLMKLARKIQADRGWDLTRAWAEASLQRPHLMSDAKHEPMPGTDSSAVSASYTEVGFIK